jgi:hypothetical protein
MWRAAQELQGLDAGEWMVDVRSCTPVSTLHQGRQCASRESATNETAQELQGLDAGEWTQAVEDVGAAQLKVGSVQKGG